MKIITISLFLIFSTASYAGKWITNNKGGCQVWNENPIANEHISFSGSCPTGKVEGKGEVQWFIAGRLVSRTQANWVDGKVSGLVWIFFENGNTFMANSDRTDGKRTGNGTFTPKTDVPHLVELVDGTPIGKGSRFTKDGTIEVSWVDGKFVPIPKAVAVASTAGEWIADKKSGCQIWNEYPVTNESITFSGACPNGKAEGPGEVQWFIDGRPISRTGIVKWINGQVSGYASITFENGDTLFSNSTDGKRTGKGNYTTKSGDDYKVHYDVYLVDGKLADSHSAPRARSTPKPSEPTSPSTAPQEEGNLCLKAKAPGPDSTPNLSTDFYGTCADGKGIDGIVIWKLNDIAYSLSCLASGASHFDIAYRFSSDRFNESSCMKFLKTIPNYCKSGGWTGQCKDGKPHGIGINESSLKKGLGNTEYRTYIGQARDGVVSGMGTERFIDQCGALGCTGKELYWFGWWANGSKDFECKEAADKCFNAPQVRADKAQKEAQAAKADAVASQKREKNKEVLTELEKAIKCEEAEQFVERQPEQERPYFAKKSCLNERRYRALEQAQNPQEIYLGAVKFESDGERSRAKSLYELIMEKFSANPIALKAADRLAALVDVEAINRSNASKEQAVRDANQAAERRQAEFERNRSAEKIDASQSCSSRISSCNNSCDPIRDGDQRYACRSGCESICTK